MPASGKGLKSTRKRGDKADSCFGRIIGDEELEKRAAVLRNMKTQEQMAVELLEDEIEAVVSSLLPG